MSATRSSLVVGVLTFLVLGAGLRIAGAGVEPQRGGAAGRKQFEYSSRRLNGREQRWLSEQLGKAPLEEKIGQLVIASFAPRFMNLDSGEFARLREMVLDQRVGGLALQFSNVYETAVLLNRLQELARLPLFVAADFETGTGMRLADTTYFPWNMAVGAAGDPRLAFLQGEATAVEARAVGINMIFAPVADVNNNPNNPVINVRSYGEDPQEVSKFVSAFIQGAQSHGVIATAKHFPGHGDTSVDSHIGLPVIDVGVERLVKVELQPFRAAIQSGVGAIMSAHVALPQIDPTPAQAIRTAPSSVGPANPSSPGAAARVTLPSTLSARILTGILRDELKFDGLVVTDSMRMAGVAARYSPEEAAVLAVKAGADILLGPEEPAVVIRAIRQAVSRGEISPQRIEQSFERILSAKVRLGLLSDRFVEVYDIDSSVSAPKYVAAAEETASRSLTLLRDNRGMVPISKDKPGSLLHIAVSSEPVVGEERFRVGAVLSRELSQRVPRTDTVVLDSTVTTGDAERLLQRQGNYGAVIASLFIRPRSGRGSIAVPPVTRDLITEIAHRGAKLMVVSFGSPYLIQELPDVPGYLCAYGDYGLSNLAQRAVAKALFGETGIQGKLSVTIPGFFPRGSGLAVSGPERKVEKAAFLERRQVSQHLTDRTTVQKFGTSSENSDEQRRRPGNTAARFANKWFQINVLKTQPETPLGGTLVAL